MRKLLLTVAAALFTTPVPAHESSFAGILDKPRKEDLPQLTFLSDKPVSDEPVVLKSGTMYEVEIVSPRSPPWKAQAFSEPSGRTKWPSMGLKLSPSTLKVSNSMRKER